MPECAGLFMIISFKKRTSNILSNGFEVNGGTVVRAVRCTEKLGLSNATFWPPHLWWHFDSRAQRTLRSLQRGLACLTD